MEGKPFQYGLSIGDNDTSMESHTSYIEGMLQNALVSEQRNRTEDASFSTVATDLTTTVAPDFPFYEMARLTTGLIFYPLFCLIGFIGNTLIIIVLSRKTMRTSTNVYLVALAVSDIIKLLNDTLYFITILLYKTDDVMFNRAYGYLYPYAHFIFSLSVCVASWLTVSVAVERYILVCHATYAKTLCTIPRARNVAIAIFVIMTACAIPSALRYRTVTIVHPDNSTELDLNVTELWKNERFVETYTLLQGLLRSIIPLFILIAMNAFIINSVRKTRANKKMASRNRITIMLIIMIIFFLICITPDAIMSAFFGYGYHEAKNYTVKGVREITDCLLALNAAVNFFLYLIFNKIFREHFCAIFLSGIIKQKEKKKQSKYKPIEEKPNIKEEENDDQPDENGELMGSNGTNLTELANTDVISNQTTL